MTTRHRTLLVLAAIVVILLVIAIYLSRYCPGEGLALTSRARSLHRLKNRTATPHESDFNYQITLGALLKPGDDSYRWSTQQAARIQGYVVAVAYARPEATNCFMPCRRDIHINIAIREGAPQKEQVVVEITPNFEEWAAKQGWDWSATTLRTQLVGHWCEFEGWMYFDLGHAEEAENTTPNNASNWRASAWEIHPVTKFRVIR